MCRWLAYSGGEIPLSELIFNTRHSLIDQSLDARLGPNTTNGDGFGVGWYGRPDSSEIALRNSGTPGLYKSVQPAWNDSNLHDLCRHISSPMFLAHIRASTGTPVQHTNCHPFRHNQWIFVHNGTVREFARIRRAMLHELDEAHFREVGGSTDSELLFLLASQFGLDDNPRQALQHMAGFVERVGWDADIEHPLQMTLGLANGQEVYAVRYSSEGDSRTLYHSNDLQALEAQLSPTQQSLLDEMTHTARCVVSEPLSDLENMWVPIPEASFLTISSGDVYSEPITPKH